jgi:hypothetical protein
MQRRAIIMGGMGNGEQGTEAGEGEGEGNREERWREGVIKRGERLDGVAPSFMRGTACSVSYFAQ